MKSPGSVLSLLLCGHFAAPAGALEVQLDRRARDLSGDGRGDISDCREGVCREVLIPLIEPHEMVATPEGASRDDFHFLVVRDFMVVGMDRSMTLGVERREGGEAVYADFNNDEKLGNDGNPFIWEKGRSCLDVTPFPASDPAFRPSLRLCRLAGEPGLRDRCESLKSRLTWAVCDRGFYELQVMDIAHGELRADGTPVKIGVADADGDGRLDFSGGDPLLIDWDGDGRLSKSHELDAFRVEPGREFVFSLHGKSFAVKGMGDAGASLDLGLLDEYRPDAEIVKAVAGQPAPDFEFLPMDDDSLRLSDLRGRMVLLNFWSFKERDCLEALERLREFHATFKGRGWAIWSLTSDPERDLAEDAARHHGVKWRLGLVSEKTLRDYASKGLPATFIINEKGVLEKSYVEIGRGAWR